MPDKTKIEPPNIQQALMDYVCGEFDWYWYLPIIVVLWYIGGMINDKAHRSKFK